MRKAAATPVNECTTVYVRPSVAHCESVIPSILPSFLPFTVLLSGMVPARLQRNALERSRDKYPNEFLGRIDSRKNPCVEKYSYIARTPLTLRRGDERRVHK